MSTMSSSTRWAQCRSTQFESSPWRLRQIASSWQSVSHDWRPHTCPKTILDTFADHNRFRTHNRTKHHMNATLLLLLAIMLSVIIAVSGEGQNTSAYADGYIYNHHLVLLKTVPGSTPTNSSVPTNVTIDVNNVTAGTGSLDNAERQAGFQKGFSEMAQSMQMKLQSGAGITYT